MKTLNFKNGDQMPILGLGTWQSEPGEVFKAVIEAIKIGYRHIDCAYIYKNEKEIGEALAKAFKDGLVKREELWITSKLWNDSHEEHQVFSALENTLKDLQLDYLDLYLVHWPLALKKGVDFPEGTGDFLTLDQAPLSKTWKKMEEAKEKGLVKHIGVSNFKIQKLHDLMESATIAPEMNQIEMHPFLPQYELVGYCKEKGIHLTAYAPLGAAYRVHSEEDLKLPLLLENTTVLDIAQRHQATPAQVVLAWGMARGTAVIPKSVNPHRLKENFDAINLKLNESELALLNQLEGPYRFTTGELWTAFNSPYSKSDFWEEYT
ncbi:aldo/keto reductase [Echinicola jeungdonensis]|uniref:Aldo/keto reductase n=1 Tax=Echinicola jeungdonensis TaxID=709343 RepID=A0ABV5J5E2_9BACT|nr:aldo/keto reductase [Echinicola jeungdonensis]MDN3670857.1 aldo/keto reductase [Echinicola jeungdonensis]